MPQATGQITFSNAQIEVTLDGGTTWLDISGYLNTLTVGGGDREVGELYTAEGDTPLLGAGKRASREVTMAIVYTKGVAEPFSKVYTAYAAGTLVAARWSPQGGAAGDDRFTTNPGYLKSCSQPGGEAQSGDPLAIEFVLQTPIITPSVIV